MIFFPSTRLTALFLTSLFILYAALHTTAAWPSDELVLKQPVKAHQIYEMTLYIPQSWKVDSEFSERSSVKHGSLMAVDQARHLSYPRNLEVRIIPEIIYADPTSRDHLKAFLPRKFSKAHRGIRNYKIDGTEIIKIAGTEDAILLFSSYRLAEDDMSHVHVAIPRRDYYFLLTYTDIKDLVGTSSESYQTFWNIIQQIKLPARSVFAKRTSGLVIVIIALVALLFLFLSLSYMRKRRSMQALIDLGLMPTTKPTPTPSHPKKPAPKRAAPAATAADLLPSESLASELHSSMENTVSSEETDEPSELFEENHENTLLSHLLKSQDDDER